MRDQDEEEAEYRCGNDEGCQRAEEAPQGTCIGREATGDPGARGDVVGLR